MDTENKVKEIIEKIKPILQNDGGNIEFVKYEDGFVYITITGVCMHCHMLSSTLEGIETAIMSEVSEVKGLKLVNEE